ncbi:MAG: hydroxylamine reductase, partial [Bacteroidales bacterium]
MFCYQCQETAQNRGCTIKGVCGKSSDVANLQDLLIYLLKGVSHNIIRMQNKGMDIPVCINRFVTESLFMTITNANFDKKRFVQQIEKAMKVRSWLTDQLGKDLATCPDCDCTTWTGNTLEEMEAKGATVGVLATNNEGIRSLRELLTYGVKGMAAYAEHAKNLGYEDPEIYAFIEEALVATTNNLSVDELTSLVLKCGEYGVKTMALLDRANTDTYGHPEVTKVDIGVRNNPAILISGHDLRDLKDLLDQTEGTGIDVYTHGEMLPAHYYPAFKKYSHFAGNYGGAWWNQNEDFEAFNGVILFTTNCIVPPRENSKYADRVYTTGAAGFSGFPHIEDRKENGAKDFSALI